MFSAKTISDRICGLIYIARFANIIHLNLNRPTKIAVCAPGLRNDKLLLIIFLFFVRFFPSFISNASIVTIHFRANLDAQNAGNGISGLQIPGPQTRLSMHGMSATCGL